MTTSNAVHPSARLTDEGRRILTADLKKEVRPNVCGPCRGRQGPGKLQAGDVSPDGRVLAGIPTRQALVSPDAGPQPAVSQQDPRVLALLAPLGNRQARNQAWRSTRITERGGRSDKQR